MPAFDDITKQAYDRTVDNFNSDCTWYAAAAVNKAFGIYMNDLTKFPSLGNAGEWANNAHAAIDPTNKDHLKYQAFQPYISSVDKIPQAGSVYALPVSAAAKFPDGHVMFVQNVTPAGNDAKGNPQWKLVVSEENAGGADTIRAMPGTNTTLSQPLMKEGVERWTRTFIFDPANGNIDPSKGDYLSSGEFIHFKNP